MGVISTGLTYFLYYLCLYYTNPIVSYFIGYILGVLFNYYLTLLFTFKVNPTKSNGLGFVICHATNLLLSEVLLNTFIYIGITERYAPIPTLSLCVPINFFMVRFVMKKNKL